MADISKITLPSGTTYDIKDAVARQMISGGVSFNIVWTELDYGLITAPSAAKLATIPKDVEVRYDSGASVATGTLTASADYSGQFYLIYDPQTSGTVTQTNYYSEYVVIQETGGYYWEKIGDATIGLNGLVTDVTLNQQTTQFVTEVGTATTDSVIGADATFSVTQPTISVTPSRTYLGASASGANVAWNSKDQVTALTGLGTPTTDTFVKSVTAETGKKLVTTSVTGVQSSTTTASKATAGTAQTTATGTGTATTSTSGWLKGWSVSNETLTINAVTMDTQSTPQYSFSDVTVPIKAASATTVATGATSATGTGDAIVSDVSVGSSASAITAITPTSDTVIGSDATFTVTQPTIALSSNSATATGRVQVATGISSATATGGNVAWNSKDAVTAVTDVGTPLKSAGLNTSTSLTVSKHS